MVQANGSISRTETTDQMKYLCCHFRDILASGCSWCFLALSCRNMKWNIMLFVTWHNWKWNLKLPVLSKYVGDDIGWWIVFHSLFCYWRENECREDMTRCCCEALQYEWFSAWLRKHFTLKARKKMKLASETSSRIAFLYSSFHWPLFLQKNNFWSCISK